MICTRQFKYEKTTASETSWPRLTSGLFPTSSNFLDRERQQQLGGSDARSKFLFERPNIQFLGPRRAVLVVQGKERIGNGADVECAIFAL